MKVDGSVVLVAGGASGLGRAVVQHLDRLGARVVVLDIAPNNVGGSRIHHVAGDICDADDVASALNRAGELGHLRAVVNCAGIDRVGMTLDTNGPLPLDQFAEVVRVNLIGAFNILRLAAARMAGLEPVAGERGVIVNIGSIAGLDAPPGMIAYVAAKAGLAGMTLTAARDLAPALIRVVTVAPGIFDTPMFARLPDFAQQATLSAAQHPSRLGDTREFAELVAHVIENAMLNGETIRIDGALRLGTQRG
ncbi:SDR family NAD(P)-dependent oxidoreductase [Nocardia cyriacigeorgica]|uniref:SDR family NAD(P)-dependent oxidoreductase n=1 Tax=Nocardia cyriacigeorgica TaxID=135487 RepID=UPI001893E983|nr:SDR family NAD(P)-dependent oxidoreductase [Nocardia cyriacigeorgica]MBF6090469.1 SDR family NAD(P)-dependent oxidoreductase [Nocardia cyriacigeorgica]MBF6098125.1 SDR family NAD(P)-dependent oxidoreductase [Nocardia cyriacigeorgica]MBF6317940.1 SDR family NAD(P)-dependent oxidoreductase [Nocardia cyriacigeorgica]MBF6398327.1 SDR family NAD(P)-dependent oxidoreductase [Nocardia cyriacigeorgica]MBF6404159.1 SDR family NAD(P)-dependent oxidoreductase [Nocardia cyriacigeorgica]